MHEARDLVQNWPLQTGVFAQRYGLPLVVVHATIGLDWIVSLNSS